MNVERLERSRSGLVAKHEPDILHSADPWFRGMELTEGPDGGVYVLDWSDAGECHEHSGVHRNSGRIYKITYGQPAAPKMRDVTRLPLAEVLELAVEGRGWAGRSARRELVDRQARFEANGAGESLAPLLAAQQKLLEEWSEHHTGPERTVPCCIACGSCTRYPSRSPPKTGSTGRGLSTSPPEAVRVWAIRFLTDEWPLDTIYSRRPVGRPEADAEQLRALLHTASFERSGLARLAMASVMQRVPVAERWLVAMGLFERPEDADDPNLPGMVWTALVPLAETDPDRSRNCRPRTPGRSSTNGSRGVWRLSRTAAPPRCRTLSSMSSTRPTTVLPNPSRGGCRRVEGATPGGGTDRLAAIRRDIRRGGKRGILTNRARVERGVWRRPCSGRGSQSGFGRSGGLAVPPRRAGNAHRPEGRGASGGVRGTAECAVPEYDGAARVGDNRRRHHRRNLARNYRSFHAADRPAVLDTLVARPGFAVALLEEVAVGKIPRGDITVSHARQMLALGSDNLAARLGEVWGELRDSPADKRALREKWEKLLTREALAAADLSRGRVQFNRVCSGCHLLYGHGQAVGPDLTGSGRRDLGYLLDNIVDPSAVLSVDYRLHVAELKDGRVLSGLVVARTPQTVTLRTAQDRVTVALTTSRNCKRHRVR